MKNKKKILVSIFTVLLLLFSTSVASAKVMWGKTELKKGQIGKITVTKPINLWERDANNKLTFERVLKPGEEYRVYRYDNLHGGQYGLGGGMYITKMPTHIKYETPSKAKLALLEQEANKNAVVKAHFLDVGQGDSVLITLTNGKNILVDGGKGSAGDEVVAYLKKAGVKTIDLMVATHPDADHIGGLIDVLKTFPVKQVVDSGKTHTTQTYLEYLNLIDSKNIPFSVAKVGQSINLDSNVKITVLNSGEGVSDNNEASVALKLSYGNMDILLTGDAETDQEELMRAKFNVEAEIYKAAHHGSDTGNSLKFLQEVSPDATVLSYGEGNSYGHPHKEVVNRLTQVGSKLYSTAESGNVIFTLTKNSYTVSAKPMNSVTTPTPNPTPEPKPQPTVKVGLVSVDEANEIVKIKNSGTANVTMTGWKLVSVEGNQTYTFPSGYVLKAGATVSITSGKNAVNNPPSQLKWTTANIWNNSGDPAQLFNDKGVKVSEIR